MESWCFNKQCIAASSYVEYITFWYVLISSKLVAPTTWSNRRLSWYLSNSEGARLFILPIIFPNFLAFFQIHRLVSPNIINGFLNKNIAFWFQNLFKVNQAISSLHLEHQTEHYMYLPAMIFAGYRKFQWVTLSKQFHFYL